ncbi:hypothetical protein GUITHDRAFT_120755 [Guillardia theta CCMP2712]|uniref:Uncharacterized protein n=1 Tax=Guillardia theta (strain CCMP2712) TaxID=905079 RepID=L1IB31_GUITC|nr:hypothetical protein GUITHDRAFT_120755 [Guillardia theta CCMP2712]EKX33060.1 hypothetical protein GUITHDRAFT_120755 [Guillardia theta CCMP2712]|eukprot:XP_005820040.1 hypothetical protein GUITHDRAFT_120755 [Guillardia theta CCMP2712]
MTCARDDSQTLARSHAASKQTTPPGADIGDYLVKAMMTGMAVSSLVESVSRAISPILTNDVDKQQPRKHPEHLTIRLDMSEASSPEDTPSQRHAEAAVRPDAPLLPSFTAGGRRKSALRLSTPPSPHSSSLPSPVGKKSIRFMDDQAPQAPQAPRSPISSASSARAESRASDQRIARYGAPQPCKADKSRKARQDPTIAASSSAVAGQRRAEADEWWARVNSSAQLTREAKQAVQLHADQARMRSTKSRLADHRSSLSMPDRHLMEIAMQSGRRYSDTKGMFLQEYKMYKCVNEWMSEKHWKRKLFYLYGADSTSRLARGQHPMTCARDDSQTLARSHAASKQTTPPGADIGDYLVKAMMTGMAVSSLVESVSRAISPILTNDVDKQQPRKHPEHLTIRLDMSEASSPEDTPSQRHAEAPVRPDAPLLPSFTAGGRRKSALRLSTPPSPHSSSLPSPVGKKSIRFMDDQAPQAPQAPRSPTSSASSARAESRASDQRIARYGAPQPCKADKSRKARQDPTIAASSSAVAGQRRAEADEWWARVNSSAQLTREAKQAVQLHADQVMQPGDILLAGK